MFHQVGSGLANQGRKPVVTVGKSLPGNAEDADEVELLEFQRLLEGKGYFAYAWTFNPKDWAMEALRETLRANCPAWLYIIHKGRPWWSRLRMLIRDFRHSSSMALSCPQEWRQYAPQQSYVGAGHFDWKNTGTPKAIHLWFLVDTIENVNPPVYLRDLRPFFAERGVPPYYREYTENSFAFLSDPRSC